MPRHYIKILDYLADYAHEAAPVESDWADRLFNDLTEGGDRISIVSLPTNEYGTRVGLCGDLFFCEARIDRERSDSLFISRIESASKRLPQEIPRKISGEFRFLGGEVFPDEQLDSVLSLFPSAETQEPKASTQVRPSSLLNKTLAKGHASLRRIWRPTEVPAETVSETGFLEQIRAVWSRHRLDRFSKLAPRATMILARQLNPERLTDRDYDLLLAPISVGLLNAFATKGRERELLALVEDLSGLRLHESLRASIWASMLAGLDQLELRRELNAAAGGLIRIADSIVWDDPVLDALEDASVQLGDESLQDRVHAARSQPSPLAEIGSWASELQFAESEPAPQEDAQQSVAGIGVDDQSAAVIAHEGETVGREQRLTKDVSAAPPPVEDWVLRLRLSGEAGPEELSQEFLARARHLTASANDLGSLAAFRRFLSDLEEFSRYLDRLQARLPDGEELDQDVTEAVSAFDQLSTALGGDAADLIAGLPTPSTVAEIADLASQSELLGVLPNWVWKCEDHPDPVSDAAFSLRVRRLLVPEVRIRAQAFAAVASEFGIQSFEQLSKIGPAPEGADLGHHLRSTLRILLDEQAALECLAPEYVELRTRAETEGERTSDVLRTVDVLEQLRSRIPREALSGIAARVAREDPGDRESTVASFLEAVNFIESNFGSAREASLSQIDGWLAQRQRATGGPAVPAAVHTELEVDHNWTTERGSRPRLSFRSEQGVPYGSIAVPLVIKARRPADYAVRIEVSLKGAWRRAWPTEWPSYNPMELDIHRSDWRMVPGHDRQIKTVTIEIPTRSPRTSRDPLELEMTLFDRGTGALLSAERVLRWSSVEDRDRDITLAWPEGLETRYVLDHPIGPQKGIQRIQNRIDSGSSFAVVAPRRFGKSTLLEYLSQSYRTNGWVVPEPVFCTSYFDGVQLDQNHLWSDISERLQGITGASLAPRLTSGVPEPDAFVHLRAAMQRMNKKGALVLLDEAQLFFPIGSGHLTGDILKDRIERSWSAEGRACPVVFGFVGLPSLLERAGANLSGLLRPIEGNEMDQSDLNRLILHVGSRSLETTREARYRLISTAPNLFLMRTLVEYLAAKLNEERRTWASYDDVVAVEADLVRQLEAGEARHVGQWVRDALNEAETVNQWQPRREYPVALAIARAKKEGAQIDKEILGRTKRLLAEWCATLHEGSLERLSFSEKQIDSHVRRLREAGVLEQLQFRSRLLEAWLVGDGRNGYPDSAANALIRGAYRVLRLPEGLEPVGEGGEAKIWRFTQDGVRKALRQLDLKTEADRRRFVETAQTLDLLSRGEHRGEPGADYIFDLESIGFLEGGEMTAAQVYRWIDGHDLAEKVGRLSPAIVAEIGLKLALAVQLLHSRGILHRDIQPKNIVVEQAEKRPVLIDFGMAQLEVRDMTTSLSSDFAAPEVKSSSPEWTRAADVFSLGKTLQSLVETDSLGDSSLLSSLRAATAERPDDRPSVQELAESLRRELELMNVRARTDAFWLRICEAAESDREKRWYWHVLVSFRSNLEALHLGIHADEFERCAEVADLVNQVLEASPRPRGERTLGLGFIKHANETTGTELAVPEIEFLHRARTWLSHGDEKNTKKRRALQASGNPGDQEMRELTRNAVDCVAAYLKLPSLPCVVATILAEQPAIG